MMVKFEDVKRLGLPNWILAKSKVTRKICLHLDGPRVWKNSPIESSFCPEYRFAAIIVRRLEYFGALTQGDRRDIEQKHFQFKNKHEKKPQHET
ncbi:hypothetical protein AgCh_028600 [Apium graveolens]